MVHKYVQLKRVPCYSSHYVSLSNMALQLNNDQLRQLIQGVRGSGRKLHSLDETSATAWVTWRGHFETVFAINNWQELRGCQEIKAAMTGAAALLVADIPLPDPPAVDEMLDDYALRFMPPAAGQVARTEFHALQQKPEETIAMYHGRGRELFLRAYPGQHAEGSVLLIQQFALGLADSEVARFVLDRNPETYADASNLAMVKYSTELALRMRKGGGRNNLHSINSVGQASGEGRARSQGPCWWCNAPGHIKADCPQFRQVNQASGGGRGQPPKRRSNGSSYSNSRKGGPNRGRQGAYRGHGPRVNAMRRDSSGDEAVDQTTTLPQPAGNA